MTDPSTIGWIAATLAVVAALADWVAVARDEPSWRWITKPTVMVAATITVVADGDGIDGSVRAWIVVAFVFSFAGDVLLLMGERRFLAGLGAFLAAHVAFVVAFVETGAGVGWLAMALVVALPVGARIVASAWARSRVLGGAVVAYLAAISAMFLTSTGTDEPLLVVGAGLFVVSDATLGWNRFVRPGTWLPLGVITTYHAAQACFALFATS